MSYSDDTIVKYIYSGSEVDRSFLVHNLTCKTVYYQTTRKIPTTWKINSGKQYEKPRFFWP